MLGLVLFSLATQEPTLAATASIRHQFTVHNLNPDSIYNATANLSGYAATSTSRYFSYNTPPPPFSVTGSLGIKDSGSGFAFSKGRCTEASAKSSFSYVSSMELRTFTGQVDATAAASAWGGCGWVSASAAAESSLSIREGKANRRGRITWKPLFSTGVGAAAGEWAWGRLIDPVEIDFLDPVTSTSLLPLELQRLLTISAESIKPMPTETDSCNESPFLKGPFVSWSDTELSGFLCNGNFKIDVSNPYLESPGLLKISSINGYITEKITTGRFEPVAMMLPNVGDIADFNIPFSSAFPTEIDLSYDFEPSTPPPGLLDLELPLEVDSVTTLYHGADAYAEVPAPFPGVGLGFAYLFSRNLRNRIKRINKPLQ